MTDAAVEWTNPSVIAFAGNQDPLDAIVRRARETVFQAFDKGWSGPPFDPIKLAGLLNISVRAHADVVDARTVPTGAGKFTIEFNPQQNRGRVRFSVAHEIAHTFFPDCALAVRHRGARVICHIVNDGAVVWGGRGFAANLRRRHPKVQEDFKDWAGSSREQLRLGNVHFANIDPGLVVASMIAQRGYGPSTTPRIRYGALQQCLETVARNCKPGSSVHMPRIGTGAAGGSWPLIESIIVDKLLTAGLAVTVYDLPNSDRPENRDLLSQ
jgi:hypothetical protein